VDLAAWEGHSFDWGRVYKIVFLPAFEFTDELLDHSEEHNQKGGHQHGDWAVDSDLREEVEDAGDEVEDVNELLELEAKGDWEEGGPGVARGLALVGGALLLNLFYVLAVEARGDPVGVKRSCFAAFLHHSELAYLGVSYFNLGFTNCFRLVDQLSGLFHFDV